jgi:hypothetical protein
MFGEALECVHTWQYNECYAGLWPRHQLVRIVCVVCGRCAGRPPSTPCEEGRPQTCDADAIGKPLVLMRCLNEHELGLVASARKIPLSVERTAA